jgi:hypothetical protein
MSNPSDITAIINGLLPNHEYIYEFYGSANWPLIVSPISGSFIASDDFYSLNATVYFCPNLTACDGNEGLIECSDIACSIGHQQFGTIAASYYDVASPNVKYYSNFIRVNHDSYPPQPNLDIISSGTLGENIFKEYDKVEIVANIDNLVTNETYYYEFRNIDSNYSNIIAPQSGYFTAYSGQQHIYAGLYLSNDNSSNSSAKIGDKYFSKVDFLVKPTGQNYSYISNTISVNFMASTPTVELGVSDTQISSTEYKDVVAHISGIIPNEQYSYVYSSMGSNWPTTISEKSGTFISNNDHFILNSILYFCPTITACTEDANLLTWNNTLSGYDDQLFTNIKLKIYPSSDVSNTISSNIVGFNNTTKMPTAHLEVAPSGKRNEEQSVNIGFTNLKSNKLYNYSLYSIEGNWPFAVSKTSGSFYADSTDYTLELIGSFCENSGICPKNSYGVLDFEAISPMKLSWYKPQIAIRLSFEDADFPSLEYYSNVAEVVCADCVPTNKSVSVSINSIPDC